MNKDHYESEKTKAKSELKWWRKVAVGLLITNLISMFVVVTTDTTEKTLITPPTIEKAFWVKGDQVSPSYLEELTRFFSTLVLNSTPKSIDGNIDEFLRYVDPSAFGAIRAQMSEKADKVKRMDISTAFYPVSYSIKTKKEKVVVVVGDFITMMGTKRVSKERRSWRYTYGFTAGRIWVKEFVEVKNDKPFDSSVTDDYDTATVW